MKRAGLYIRVSTQEQAQEGYSIPAQKERLINYCRAHDWVIADIYADGGFSGANIDRPGIQKLIREVSNFDVALVYKLDRLSRSQRDTLYLIEEVFLPNGVDFVSVSESFDTSSPFGKAMVGMLSVFAQLEREQIKERTHMGRVTRAKAGLFHGGACSPIGYNYVDGKLVVNEYEAAQIKKIFDWYCEGESLEKIAQKLRDSGYTNRYGSWNSWPRIGHVLQGEVYLGRVKFGEVYSPDAHEALITQEQFDRVKEIRKKRHEIYGDMTWKGRYLLSGMVFCAQCGARYYVNTWTKTRKTYSCYSRGKSMSQMIKDPNCKNKHWKLQDLEQLVENEVRTLLTTPGLFDKMIVSKPTEKENPEAAVINNRIKDLDKQIGRLMELYQKDEMPFELIGGNIKKLHKERTALTNALSDISTQAPPPDYSLIRELLNDAAAIWDFADMEQKRGIIQELINRIIIDDEDVTIEWSFI